MTTTPLLRFVGIAFLFYLLNTGYVWAFATPSVFYMGNVVIHLVAGLLLSAGFFWLCARDRAFRRNVWVAAGVLAVSVSLGLYLARYGNIAVNRPVLLAHIVTGVLGTVALLPYVWRAATSWAGGWATYRTALGSALSFALAFPVAITVLGRAYPERGQRIQNPLSAPLAMEHEGGGSKSPFFPSSSQTNVGGKIPSDFFLDSARCGECHKEIYDQWKSSMHHFASFNNQFYRKSIEYMQSVVGTQPSKWCAGCHDHAMLFNGRFDVPAAKQIDTPEAQAGLGCMSCHSISAVDSTMGNAGFTIEYPALHELVNSKSALLKKVHDFLTYLQPEPHRRSFMKPFMKADSSEYCSSCHKVHLDVPVNGYRWIRGFNDYDNWQASGVSGQGARSFYYPPKSSTCVDCHMPQVNSQDIGNKNGKIHQHRFLGANTAVPFVNGDHQQLKTAQDFLKSGFITVDLFAMSPITETKNETKMVRRGGEGPQLMSSIAVGEEGDQAVHGLIREVGKIAAPLDAPGVTVKPGSSVRVDVVVRTRRMGHFFPGGTVDAFDIWLELKAEDTNGKVLFWSGSVDEDGKGAVEPGAHFYRAYQLDAEGNPINKRNAWQTRTVLYARQIPPGAADTVHYRLDLPKDVKGPIRLSAKLNHRKFSRYYTEFAYAGEPKPGQDAARLSPAHNSLDYSFEKANIPANVSGKLKGAIPDIPITVLAQSQVALEVAEREPSWQPAILKKDRERWNDWGIGLLLQGDLKGAEYAFQRVTEAEPGYADGWLNVARTLIQEGETDAAKPFVAKALQLGPDLGRVHYFNALIQKADGDYDGSIKSLRTVVGLYPRDRVVLNQLARILFLKREYQQALDVSNQVALVDPEDLQMHYTAMLCYKGLGKNAEAAREEALFKRFKAEESSQSITAKRRMVSPEDNNERQSIHDHESTKLAVTPRMQSSLPNKEKAVLGARLLQPRSGQGKELAAE